MLKIKDEVDLKELEKFGFELDEDDNYYDYYPLDRSALLVDVYIENKEVRVYTEGVNAEDILYDLIQAGLVEKVEG